MSDLEDQKPGVSRRTVAKAMAWSVPAVALAVPAPAYAASPGIVTLDGTACKEPGNPKNYVFGVVITNDTNAPITVDFLSMNVNGVTRPVLQPLTTTVPAFTQRTIVVQAGQYADSANGVATLFYEVNDVEGQAGPTDINDIPPVQNPDCLLGAPGTFVDVQI